MNLNNGKCRLEGLEIKPVSWWHPDHSAQRRGFCGAQCEATYDALHEMQYRAAREGRAS